MEATEKEICERLFSGLKELSSLCDEQLAPTSNTAAAPMTADNQEEPAQRTPFEQLYHDRNVAAKELMELRDERKARPNVPESKYGLDCSDYLQLLEQGPWLTKADYDTLCKGQLVKLIHDCDGVAVRAGLIQASQVQPVALPSQDAEDFLTCYFDKYGTPGLADLFVLSRTFGIPKNVLEKFFEAKRKTWAPVMEAKSMLRLKEFLQDKELKGELDQFMKEEREKDAKARPVVGGMD